MAKTLVEVFLRMSKAKSWPAGSRNLWVLRGASVVLPLIFLAVFNYVSHFHVSSFARSVPGFLVLVAILGLGIYLFSHFVFTWLARAENESRRRAQELLILK